MIARIRTLLFAGLLLLPSMVWAACDADVLDIRQGGSEIRFSVEVVDTVETRAQGLMFRESLPRFSGMLFVYERPQPVSFWMKNTLIPLDMIFAGADGVVRRIHSNAIPGDLTGVPGGNDIQYVLEINGGLAETLGLRPGAVVRHPAIDAGLAAWPCDAAGG